MVIGLVLIHYLWGAYARPALLTDEGKRILIWRFGGVRLDSLHGSGGRLFRARFLRTYVKLVIFLRQCLIVLLILCVHFMRLSEGGRVLVSALPSRVQDLDFRTFHSCYKHPLKLWICV
jgi:hypothetical protein